MPVKDLPFTSVPVFNGTIGDFIRTELGEDGHVSTIVLNPGNTEEKEITDPSTARVYIDAAIGLPFDWKWLAVGQHSRIQIRANIGFSKNAGVIWTQGDYYRANAQDKRLVPTATPLLSDPRWGQANFEQAAAIDTILRYTVKIDLNAVDALMPSDRSLKPFADFLQTLLDAPDIPTAQAIRAKARAEKAERAQEWRNAKNASQTPGFQKPAVLMATVDGVPIDLYTLTTGVRLYRMKDDGVTPTKSSCMWDASDVAIAWVQASVDAGRMLGTENALRAAGKIN